MFGSWNAFEVQERRRAEAMTEARKEMRVVHGQLVEVTVLPLGDGTGGNASDKAAVRYSVRCMDLAASIAQRGRKYVPGGAILALLLWAAPVQAQVACGSWADAVRYAHGSEELQDVLVQVGSCSDTYLVTPTEVVVQPVRSSSRKARTTARPSQAPQEED